MSKNINKLRKLERITQEALGDFVPRIIPSINALEIKKQDNTIAYLLLSNKNENKIIIPEQEYYKWANELLNNYQKEAPEIGTWDIYLNKKDLEISK